MAASLSRTTPFPGSHIDTAPTRGVGPHREASMSSSDAAVTRPRRVAPAFLHRIRAAHNASMQEDEEEEQLPNAAEVAEAASQAYALAAAASSTPLEPVDATGPFCVSPRPRHALQSTIRAAAALPPLLPLSNNAPALVSSLKAGGAASSRAPLAANTAGTSNIPEDPTLSPPDNFAMVSSFVYRSSFPKKKHFEFLKTLGLKSVLTLILEEYPEQNMRFLDEQGIRFFQYGIPGNKEPFVQIPEDMITAALITILDRRNHPMLIHCNKGKHRTGCLIGCLRKLQQWSLTTIFDEYRRFSAPKSRSMDQEFIELYAEQGVWRDVERKWLPSWSVLGKKIAPLEEEDENGNKKPWQPTHGL